MTVESLENESTQNNCPVPEPTTCGEKITLWNGREVTAFPADPFYKSVKSNYFCNMLMEKPRNKPRLYTCNFCKSGLVDYFDRYTKEPPDEAPGRPQIVAAVFNRTCKNCFNTIHASKIFTGAAMEHYSVPIGLAVENNEKKDLEDPLPLIEPTSFSDRLRTFVDNSGQDLEDINEALIAGMFRSFGIVRDSVDFFVAVGNFLKEKVGITKNKEIGLLYGGDLEEDAQKSLKEVSKPSNLEAFRKIFPTGREIQQAACDHLGIKYEPDTPVKRVLEEIGAAFPFGPLWMAISAIGQTSQELGLIAPELKPFYEMGLAVVCLKGLKSSPDNLKNLSKTLSRKIDAGKIQKGNLGEITKLEKEVKFFIEGANKKKTTIKPPLKAAETIPPTEARNFFGWKVGDPINNRTITGDIPTWSAVRARHWKNKALDHKLGKVKGKLEYEPTPENMARMEKGLAPQNYNFDKQKWESIELHHEPPQREGGLFDFKELTLEEHAKIDAQRAYFLKN